MPGIGKRKIEFMFSFNDDNLTKSTDVQIIICYNVDEMMQELFLESSRRELIGSNNIMIQKCMSKAIELLEHHTTMNI